MAEATLPVPDTGAGHPRSGDRTARPEAAPPPAPPHHRGWLLAFWAAVFAALLGQAPGKMTFDTKLPVVADPFGFLGDLGQLWHDRAGFGGISDQYIGYAFPMLPYYALTHLLHVPVWIAERLWMSLIVAAAFWGTVRLAERLRIGAPATRGLAGAAYALWPTFTIVVGSTSAAALPGALLPWVLLPLADPATGARVAAARSALLVPFMGGVNAASTLASLLPVLLYLLSRPAGRRKRATLAWWIPCTVLATAWWTVPLVLLGVYGENFMPFIEQANTTTATMSATELLRGAGNWVAYLNFGEPWLPAGWTSATYTVAVLGSAAAAALGLAGLARRDLPERRWLLLTVLSVTLIALAGYGGTLGGLFDGTVRGWLDGGLSPFRNIYKFQPGLALALVLGIAHVLALPVPRSLPGRKFLPLLAALLILPGLAWPYLGGTVLQPGPFRKLPAHWEQTADWLREHSPDNRALVVPATAHGLYTWGDPIDQPLDVLAESPWAQRDFVPFGTPGSRRAMDAVEQALMTGGEIPGLRDFLLRAGLYDVVVRNDLDPDQIGYVPPRTVRRALEASGYHQVTAFGPVLTGGRIPDDTPVQVQGLYPRQRAVEIYAPDGGRPPGEVTAKAVADTAVLSGGPESLLQLSGDPTMRDRPTVLAGDGHPGLTAPRLQAVADGMRRADTRFGLVNNNTSYTYGPHERNPSRSVQDPGAKPRQILPLTGVRHQTTAVLRGASSVTASSSGNWLFHLPQYDPVNAFDGDRDTAWAEGSAGEPVGQWLRAEFAHNVRIPSSIRVTPLPGDGMRPAPTWVRVETDTGSIVSPLQPNGRTQTVGAPAGPARWLKVTITGSQEPKPGLSGAGFSEISIPGVRVARVLALPADSEDTDAPARVYSLHRSGDPGGLSSAAAEAGLHRGIRTGSPGTYAFSGLALPMPGPALDRLLDRVAPGHRGRIQVTADSTGTVNGTDLSPRNLVDGDLTTAWIAGDRPVLHLRWPEKRKVGELVLAAAGGLSTRPEHILINSPDGAATAGVDENGQARFDPITTDRLDITIDEAAPLTVHNPVADQQLQLPVGLSEVHVPALADLVSPQSDPNRRFSLPCGQGPELTVDGAPYATAASGRVRDLTERRPVKVRLCAAGSPRGALDLGAGGHRIDAGDTGPLALTDITLRHGEPPATAEPGVRPVRAMDWSGDRRTVAVGSGPAVYLQTYENANDGWKATLNGRPLASVRLDGWQQGFLIPAGSSGTVHLTYEPADVYGIGLLAAAAGILVLLALALVRRRASAPPPGTPLPTPPRPGWFLGTIALAAVLAVVAGPLALVVPVLSLLAWLRPNLLAPTALLAMAAAGIVAATGAGEPVAAGEGAYSAAAQVLAVVALTAAVVTVLPRLPVRATRPAPPLPPPAGGSGPEGGTGPKGGPVAEGGGPAPDGGAEPGPVGLPFSSPPPYAPDLGKEPGPGAEKPDREGEEPRPEKPGPEERGPRERAETADDEPTIPLPPVRDLPTKEPPRKEAPPTGGDDR